MSRPGLAPEEIVDGLYQGVLGRPPDAAGRSHHLAALSSGGDLRAVIHSVRHSPEAALGWLRSDAADRGPELWESVRRHPGERQIYFLHIMKTAGTSLMNALAGVAGGRLCLTQIFLDHVPFLPAPVLRHSALVAGHLGHGVIPLLAPDVRVATVIREPVSRVLSHYAHIRRDPAVRATTADLTLEEFLHSPRWRPLVENFQARHLVHDVGVRDAWTAFSPPERLATLEPRPLRDDLPLQILLDYGPLGVGPEDLQRTALARLETLDLVGVTDRLADFVSRLAAWWGVAQPPALPRDNVGVGTVRAADVPTSLLREIGRATAVDRALYERARELSGGG